MFGARMPSSRFYMFGSNSRFPARLRTITNLIVNGNFANGGNWAPAFGTESILNNTYTLTGSGSNVFPYASQDMPELTVGRQYYLQVKALVTNSNCSRIYLAVGGVSPTIVSAPTINTRYSVSLIFTASSTVSNLRLINLYASAELATNAVMEIQYVTCIDLTADFGAGSEPTKTQMDASLARFPDSWFDGTVTITV